MSWPYRARAPVRRRVTERTSHRARNQRSPPQEMLPPGAARGFWRRWGGGLFPWLPLHCGRGSQLIVTWQQNLRLLPLSRCQHFRNRLRRGASLVHHVNYTQERGIDRRPDWASRGVASGIRGDEVVRKRLAVPPGRSDVEARRLRELLQGERLVAGGTAGRQ